VIVLDTNVVSEPLRREADPAVLEWLDKQATETLFLTAVTVAELHAGLDAMPKSRRRQQLSDALIEQIMPLFAGRVLAFDLIAAQRFGQVYSLARAAGDPISFVAGVIAAIASANGFLFSTRNSRDVKGTGIGLIDPWVH
jgi:toxin FitB